MALFLFLALLMLATALAILLTPLLRTKRRGDTDPDRRRHALEQAHAAGVITADEYQLKLAALDPGTAAATSTPRPRSTLVAILAIALLLPAATLVLYRVVGTPQGLEPQPIASATNGADGAGGVDLQQAIAGLAAKLEQDPSNAEGWALLGRAYQATEQFGSARDAFKHALDLTPGNPDLMVEYAQALAMTMPEHQITGAAREQLDAALKIAPEHQRGLWLLGISDYQAGDYPAAITAWNQLLAELPAGSDIARNVKTQIDDAQALASSQTPPPRAAPAQAAAAAPSAGTDKTTAQAPSLSVHVQLDPALKDKLPPNATLFVFARAASGPPMPLAIVRTTADKLPATFVLDEGMGMLPNMKLSMFPQVVIGARISASGEALPHSGDLQTLSAPVDVNQRDTIELTIRDIVP